MKTSEALSIVLEAATVRRDQWLRSEENDFGDGDLSDCIGELYEAEPHEAKYIADQLNIAIEIIKSIRP